ncbi:COA8 family protein CBG23705, mitochondrial [Dermacentor andersoni]|uniref:COA8 family protein CBG23705, mitochondrial n=1 Tax=Dermacentor andersoni TaxID=34620 RepID=UPI0021559156|nr:COA8 family protein CBG23705, mitochondrial-like [Dermacentor andersoni]
MKGVKRALQLLSKNSKTGAVKVSKAKDSVRPQDVQRLSAVATVVSPPHPVSNLRHVVLPARPNESAAELLFRKQYGAMQAWNQDYWSKHNAEFQRKKEEFTQRKLAEYKTRGTPRDSVPIEDMASFYKSFLNDNHQKHMQYNWAWYRKNIGLLMPALLASWAYFYREVLPSVVGRTK